MYSMFNGEDEILILAFPMLPMTWEKINVFLIMMSPISEYKDQNKFFVCLFFLLMQSSFKLTSRVRVIMNDFQTTE